MPYKFDNLTRGTQWYALWTRSRQEKKVASMLDELRVPHFLPLRTERRQWSDRIQTITTPLFAGYLFVQIDILTTAKLQVLKVPGTVGFVGNSCGPSAIKVEQIESIQAVLNAGVNCFRYSSFQKGDRVRVVRGPLFGVEGTLVRINSEDRLVISVDMIQQSIGVSVSRQDVEPLREQAA